MSENQNIKSLLSNVGIISEKYDEIAKITGEKFNVFSVMGMESDEVKTHSRIIAELLNPRGSHSQGSIFLKLFFEEFEEMKEIENFEFEKAIVLVEEHIGIINEDYTKGGYIDIVIKDSKNQVVIENKIYAIDQPGQLLRYKNHYPKCKLLYLTLDCKEPSEDSKRQLVLGTDFHCVSYKTNILNWLEKCHKETIEKPMLREMIKQYIYLIKKLTNQTTNNKMSEEIVEILSKNVKGSFEVSANISDLKAKLYRDFIKHVIAYAKENEMDVDDYSEEEEEYGIYLKPKKWQDKLYKICVVFEGNYNGLYCGVSYMEGISPEVKDSLKENFNQNGYNVDNYWIWQYHSKKNWGDNSEIWVDVANGKEGEVYKEVIERINNIIAIERS